MIPLMRTQSVDAVQRTTQAPIRPDDPLGNPEHRQAIGWIGLVLPFALIAIALQRDGKDVTSLLDSMSAYYYSGADALFLGMLVSLSLFLFTYRGYENDDNKKDRVAANWAAIGALLVAFFPTEAPTGITGLIWWKSWMGFLHFFGAFVLFSCFAYFALFLFRKRSKLKESEPKEERAKSRRNGIYWACGLTIVGCIFVVAWLKLNDQPIWLPESIALVAFALSWLVKGYSPELLFRKMPHGVWALVRAIPRAIVWLVWPPATNVPRGK